MTSIAFTGTREGMATDQWNKAVEIAMQHYEKAGDGEHQFHDGDCLGADTQIHGSVSIMRGYLSEGAVTLHGHPCNISKWRAYNEYDVLHSVKPPLVRNRIMVDSSDLLIAGPFQYHEQHKGSGTWATIRYAKLRKVELYIVWPDASVTHQDYS